MRSTIKLSELKKYLPDMFSFEVIVAYGAGEKTWPWCKQILRQYFKNNYLECSYTKENMHLLYTKTFLSNKRLIVFESLKNVPAIDKPHNLPLFVFESNLNSNARDNILKMHKALIICCYPDEHELKAILTNDYNGNSCRLDDIIQGSQLYYLYAINELYKARFASALLVPLRSFETPHKLCEDIFARNLLTHNNYLEPIPIIILLTQYVLNIYCYQNSRELLTTVFYKNIPAFKALASKITKSQTIRFLKSLHDLEISYKNGLQTNIINALQILAIEHAINT